MNKKFVRAARLVKIKKEFEVLLKQLRLGKIYDITLHGDTICPECLYEKCACNLHASTFIECRLPYLDCECKDDQCLICGEDECDCSKPCDKCDKSPCACKDSNDIEDEIVKPKRKPGRPQKS